MYLAKFTIGHDKFQQGLLSVQSDTPSSVLGDALTCWRRVVTLVRLGEMDGFCRIATSNGKTSLVVGLTQVSGSDESVESALAEIAGMFPTRCSRPGTLNEHDDLLVPGFARRSLLNGWGYKIGNAYVAAEASISPHVSRLVHAAASNLSDFQYQLNLSLIKGARELERIARKNVLKLESEPYVPADLLSIQARLAARIGRCEYLVDEGFAADDSFEMYVRAIVEDEFALQRERFGFRDSPILQGEDAEDWFSTGIHLSKLDNHDISYFVASAREASCVERMFESQPTAVKSSERPIRQTDAEPCYDVFLSYSSVNVEKASIVCDGVEANGIRCWMAPRDIQPGESYPAAIVRALHACPVLVLVFSASANFSPHVRREVERALSLGKIIIPFRLDDTSLSQDMEYLISSCHWIDAKAPPMEQHITSLINALKRIL